MINCLISWERSLYVFDLFNIKKYLMTFKVSGNKPTSFQNYFLKLSDHQHVDFYLPIMLQQGRHQTVHN